MMYFYNAIEQDLYSDNLGQEDEDQMNMGMDMDLGMGMDMDMGMDMPGGISGRDILLEDDIVKAITGEAQAYYYYENLAELASSDEEREIIKGIQEDEAKHYHWFMTILRRMGGELPQIPMGEMPDDFEEGVKKAIMDELEANEFYLDIAYRATDPYIEMHFMHAAHDEQRHATLLQYILLNMM